MFIVFHSSIHAQNYTVSFLGKNDLRKANYFYKKKNYEEAVKLYGAYLAHKEKPLKAKIALANSLKQLYRTTESETWYKKAFSDNKNSVPSYCQLDFAEVLVMNGKIAEANEQVKTYLSQNPSDDRAALLLRETSQYPSFYKDSLQYSILPYFANSAFSDYAPAYYKNEIVFCSSRPSDGIIKHVEASSDQPLSHLFISDAKNQQTSLFNALNHPSKHDGPATFWANGTKTIYCSNTDEFFDNGKLTLLYSEYLTEKTWSKPVVLPFATAQYSYGHPAFDEQTNTLYFVSNIPEGYGGTDIYRVEYKNNQWGTPINLGGSINTGGNEMYPFQSKGLLYFASDGHTGMGGLDVFACRTDSSGSYLTNLGHPINSAFDDFGLILSDTEPTGLFSSNRTGNDDIYTVKIYRINLTLDISDQLNYKPLAKCIVKVSEQETGEVKYILNSDKNGHVACELIPGKNYSIKIYKSGYAMKSLEFAEYNREQQHARQSITIARTHQRYVKAKILQQSTLVRNCEVKLLDYSSDTIMTYQADSSGSFLCQINSDTTALLYFKKDNLQGYALFNKDEDARENSGITYITVPMAENLALKPITGRYFLADTNATGIANTTLYCKSRMTKQLQTVKTDAKGAFTLQAEPWEIYDLYDKEDSHKAISSIDVSAVNHIEIEKKE